MLDAAGEWSVFVPDIVRSELRGYRRWYILSINIHQEGSRGPFHRLEQNFLLRGYWTMHILNGVEAQNGGYDLVGY